MRYTGPELCALSAVEVVTLLRKGEVSSEELIRSALERISVVDPEVNAVPTLCAERAYKQATKIKTSGSFSTKHSGWLFGLPITIKDLNNVSGVRTTFGNYALKNNVSKENDPIVDRLEERGAIILGKTNTPEFGAGGNTFNEVFGMTRNPWNTAKNAGGSSGGAAVSLATGEIWLSHGSDLAGSLRTPAAYCGVVGLRPSPGRCGGGPPVASFLNESTSGPMARNVKDLALFLDSMTGFDPRMPISLDSPSIPFQSAVNSYKSNIKIAFSTDQGGFAPVENEIRQAIIDAMKKLEKAGAHVDEKCPKLPNLYETYVTLRGIHYATVTNSQPEAVKQKFKATLKGNLRRGLDISSQEIFNSYRSKSALYQIMRNFLNYYDVFALPVVGIQPGPVEQEFPKQVDEVPVKDYVDWLSFSFLATTTGLPSIAMPICLSNDKIPIGIQLIGPPRGERVLLQAARFLEEVVEFEKLPIDPIVNH